MDAIKWVKIGVRYKISRECHLLAKCVRREITAAEHFDLRNGGLEGVWAYQSSPCGTSRAWNDCGGREPGLRFGHLWVMLRPPLIAHYPV